MFLMIVWTRLSFLNLVKEFGLHVARQHEYGSEVVDERAISRRLGLVFYQNTEPDMEGKNEVRQIKVQNIGFRYQLRFVPLFTTIRKSLKLNSFIEFLNSSWTLTLSSFFFSSCRDDTSAKATFFQHLVEDRTDSASSYYEFLQHVQQQMSK